MVWQDKPDGARSPGRMPRRLFTFLIILALLAGGWLCLSRRTMRLIAAIPASRIAFTLEKPLVSDAGTVVWLRHAGSDTADPMLLGWDGRIHWSADMRLPENVTHAQAISPDGCVIACLYIDDTTVHIDAWRDGKPVAPPLRLFISNPTVYNVLSEVALRVDNAGRILACVSYYPNARLLLIRDGRIIARGAFTSTLRPLDSRYVMEFTPDGSALNGMFGAGDGKIANFEHLTLAVHGDRILVRRQWAQPVVTDFTYLPDGKILTMWDEVVDNTGKRKLPFLEIYPIGWTGKQRWVVTQALDWRDPADYVGETPLKVYPPKIVDRYTHASWRVPNRQIVEGGLVSDDGRFAVLDHYPRPPHQLLEPIWRRKRTLTIYARPGRFRARVPASGLRMLSENSYGYLLSPDGHSLALMHMEHGVRMYRW